MRKMVSLLPALVLVCTFAACGQKENQDDAIAPIEENSLGAMEISEDFIRAPQACKPRGEYMDQYAIVMVGYPNWRASIPMPIASYLEEYDFSGKTLLPFCSHGGGRFGQSLTAVTKLVPYAAMGEALSIHYSGDSELPRDVAEWLKTNGIG